MSEKTLEVMQEQLKFAEKYIEDLSEAETKAEFIKAINTCKDSIQNQYEDLEQIADDYCARAKSDKDLDAISNRIGHLLGKEVTKFYGKMGTFMADADFMEAFAQLDIVVGNNPLFGVNQFGGDVAAEVSKTIAGSMDNIATKIISETTETSEETTENIIRIMNDFLQLSKRYVGKMSEANTGRKAVMATDAFVNSIKKMIPEMKDHTDQLKLIMARPDKPKQVTDIADELKKTLGDDFKEVMKDKEEIIKEQKVQKAVSKLGAILNEVPF